ncbi:MAG: ATP-sensitive inward rectifier potassium channel 10 [Deltaproteobacteria bacterium]|nr:MAG: ATP-sensitive inward rectifier potassium channel 10 [Deltaproteobacteria bacterium]TMQ16020.1 MAG: ATP-sensitive inward rectifier potassium channel 10 [Deltaproteobacteria bacterium]
MASRKSVQPVVDARGRLLLERRGLPRSLGAALGKDAYHFLRTASWTRITLLFAALFLIVNLIFAAILYLGRAEVMNAHGFVDDFWFSVQTLATIGYGYLAPGDALANAVVTVESFVGIGLTAMITGVFFARFATPYAKVIFSSVAIIGEHDGKRTLMFRMANARATAIVEATCRVYVSRDETLADGERMRRIYDLPLRRSTSPIFALSWLATHTIDATSPIADVTPETIAASNLNLIVTFQGIDDRLAATVHTRYAYNAGDIVFDRRFADIVLTDPETGMRYVDHDRFDDTEPASSAAATNDDVRAVSAADPARPG